MALVLLVRIFNDFDFKKKLCYIQLSFGAPAENQTDERCVHVQVPGAEKRRLL
jgi:hypothetical protein